MMASEGIGAARTAIEVWKARVAASADSVAYRYRGGSPPRWIDLTWRQSDEAAREIAGGLASSPLNVRRGDTVCILAQTRIEWVLCDVGVLLCGGATVPIYASSTAEQCAFIIRDSGAKVVIVEDAAQLEKVLPLRAQMPGLAIVYMSGDAPLDKPDAQGRKVVALSDEWAGVRGGPPPISLEALREAGKAFLAADPGELDRRGAALVPGDLFTIIYTSGTTGNPKGVVLTHENLVSGCASACRAMTLEPQDNQLLFLPLAHVLGCEMQWAVVTAGAPTAIAESLTKIKDNLVDIRPTFMAGVPRIYEKFFNAVQAGAAQGSPLKRRLVAWAFSVGDRRARLLRAGKKPGAGLAFQHAIADKLVLSKLRARLGLDRSRFLLSGGAPLAAEISEFFHGLGLLVVEGYGLTETMAAAFVNRLERYRFGTVGPALDVVECKIADDGEILMRGPSVFKRYHNNPAATAEAIDPQGWFHSGDIGELEDGFLRITDRKKDLIVTAGGKKIAPAALENALKTRTPLVSQVMVYGDKRPYCIALITLGDEAIKRFGGGDAAKAAASPEARAALQQEIDALNGTLASYESIKSFAIIPADFTEASGELTPSLKVKRKVVIERHRAVIDGLYGGGKPTALDSRSIA
jgi:long-chain acyl-CoA synthetase